MGKGIPDLSGNSPDALVPRNIPRVMLTAVTANSDSDELFWAGGEGEFSVEGVFDTCTVALYMRNLTTDGWKIVGAFTTFTTGGVGGFVLSNCEIMARVSSVGGSTSVSAKVNRAG